MRGLLSAILVAASTIACAELDPLDETACAVDRDCVGGRQCVDGACRLDVEDAGDAEVDAAADVGGPVDAGREDAGSDDAGSDDAAPRDAGRPDAARPNRPPQITSTELVVDGVRAELTVEFFDPDAGAGVTALRIDWGEPDASVQTVGVEPAATRAVIPHDYESAGNFVVQVTATDGALQSEAVNEVALLAFPRTGLVTEYELDGEDFADSSGRGNDATGTSLCVEPAPDRTGFSARAVALNSMLSGGDGCGLDDTGRFTFDDPGVDDDFTISVWLQPEQTSDDSLVLGQIGAEAFSAMWARLVTGRDLFLRTTERISFIVPDVPGIDGEAILQLGTSQTPGTTWFNVTVTVDSTPGAGATGILYIDGFEQDRASSASPIANPAPGALWIAGNADDSRQGNRFYRGFMDDVRYYDRALTANEVAAIIRFE